jgi:hypothetical protein
LLGGLCPGDGLDSFKETLTMRYGNIDKPNVKHWPKEAKFIECGCYGAFHAAEFPGSIDCRDDSYRYDYDDIEARYGDNWIEITLDE